MFELTDSKGMKPTHFQEGDIIEVGSDRHGKLYIRVTRDDGNPAWRLIFMGKNQEMNLATQASINAKMAWPIVRLFLEASWILTEVELETDACVLARVKRVATCQLEMDPRLPCCDAVGDGYGRD
jgi:hypothetical protein